MIKMSITDSDCPLCGAGNIKQYMKFNERYSLMKCEACSFVFSQPTPNTEELLEYYNSQWKFTYSPTPLSPARAMRKVKSLQCLIRLYKKDAIRCLDIGCSFGHTLYGLKLYNYDVVGTDLSKSACEFAKKHYDILIYNSEFPPKDLLSSFDVLILSEIVEHVINPHLFLKSSLKYLT